MITVVLLRDVKNLGKKGDVVTVKPGYARNFLLRNKLAKPAQKHDLENFKKRQEFLKKSVKERNALFAEIDDIVKKRIKQRGLMIRRSANNKGILYDKVDKNELKAELLTIVPELQVFHVEVLLEEPLDKIGKHPVEILIRTENRERIVTIIVDIVERNAKTKMKYSKLKQQLQKSE